MPSILYVALIASFATIAIADDITGIGYVTHFGNKHYWEHTQPRTQEGAAEFCREIGFELAQIDSVEERDHLYSEAGGYDYWTSGIDIVTTKRFQWDLEWNEKNPILIPIEDIRPYSGIYFARNQNKLKTTELSVSMRPLCQHIAFDPEACKK